MADQLHKEGLALRAAEAVPEPNVLIVYDRALLDDKAYITDGELEQVLARFGLSSKAAMEKYDAVLHLVTCAKGAESFYKLDNNARTEPPEQAVELDERTLRAWSSHPNRIIVDNAGDFEHKLRRAVREILRITGRPLYPENEKMKL